MVCRHATKNRLGKRMDRLHPTTHCDQNPKHLQIHLHVTPKNNNTWKTTKSGDTESGNPQIGEESTSRRVPATSEGILGTKSTMIPQETLLGPCNQLKTQHSELLARKSILLDTTRTRSIKRISGKTTGKRIYPTVQKPICCPLLLHQKEKQRTTTHPRLLKSKQMDSEEPIPPPTHTRTNQSSERGKPFLKI